MARRISNEDLSKIGSKRMNTLMDLSEEAVRDGNIERGRRYISIARSIGRKTREKMPKDRRYCKNCDLPMMPGINCTVRLCNHKVCIKCDVCGEVRRIPYIREQRS